MPSIKRLPRRTVLKGLGTSIFLPYLEIMAPSKASALDATAPRFAAMYISLGTYGLGYNPAKNDSSRYPSIYPTEVGGMGVWQPAKTGAFTTALGPALQPLESLKQKVTILSGLGTLPGDELRNGINHSLAVSMWLTSAFASRAIALTGGQRANNPPDSIDQFIANSLGISAGSTLVLNPSAYDGTETEGGHHGYVSYNSKLGANTVVPKVTDPLKAFNRLFGSCKPSTTTTTNQGQVNDTKSVLDTVMGSITSLQKKLGTEDKVRLDSYFQGIRDLEVQLTNSQTQTTTSTCPTAPGTTPGATSGGLAWISTMNMFVDVIALALGSGVMPVATLMTDTEANGDPSYAARVEFQSNFIGLNGQKVKYHSSTLDTHVDITHVDDGNVQAIEEHIAYTQMCMSFFARLANKLDSMPKEPNGLTPLDNSILQVGSCHNHAGYHGTHNLPLLLAGGKKFGLAQGQHIAFPKNSDIGDMYFTMLKGMGISASAFNGHTKILSGLFSGV